MKSNGNWTKRWCSSSTSRAKWSHALCVLATFFIVQVIFLHQLYDHAIQQTIKSKGLDRQTYDRWSSYIDSGHSSSFDKVATRNIMKDHDTRPKEEQRVVEYPKIVFLTVMRNMNKPGFFDYLFPKFFALAKAITSEFHFVIIENDSSDGTRTALQQRFANQSCATLVFLDNLLGDRTTILSTVRNQALVIAKERFSHFDYFAVLDMDGVCGGPDMSLSYDANIFKYVLLDLKEEWDIISFRFEPYWDFWAFRHAFYMPSNFFASNGQNKLSRSEDMVPIFESVPWPNGLIEVQSAFQMFALYRMSLLREGGADDVQYSSLDENGQADCEHVAFHRALREKRNARVRLSPLVYCQGDAGYKPLPRSVTNKFPPNASMQLTNLTNYSLPLHLP